MYFIWLLIRNGRYVVSGRMGDPWCVAPSEQPIYKTISITRHFFVVNCRHC